MNIIDVGNPAETVQATPANERINVGNTSRAGEENPVRQAQPAERRDEYIRPASNTVRERRDEYVPQTMRTVRNALYDIVNIRNNGSVLSSRIQEGMITASGEKISRKLVEMKLPIGIKSLRIFRKVDQSALRQDR